MAKLYKKNIRKNFLLDFLQSFLWCLLVCPFYFYIIESNSFENIFMIFILIFLSFFAIFTIYNLFKSFYYFLYPPKTYEKLDKILEEINKSIQYEDTNIIISTNYILYKKDYRKLLKLNDILGIYIYTHKTNFIVDYYSIVATNKYNITEYFKYKAKQKENIDKALFVLQNKCPNAKFGYSDETLEYIKNNTIRKN